MHVLTPRNISFSFFIDCLCVPYMHDVTPKVTGFEKGVLDCGSLKQAEDAPELLFGLTNSEVCSTYDRAVVTHVCTSDGRSTSEQCIVHSSVFVHLPSPP